MKSPRIFAFVLIGLSLVNSIPARAADPAAALVKEATAAYQRGDLDVAKAKFESVRQLDPKNAVAIKFLTQIQAKQAELGGGKERVLAQLMVPSVKFKEAELTAALEALRAQVTKLSEGKQSVNFVVQVPEEQAKTPITLNLANVPFTEVLKYVGTLAGVTFAYDKYAILVQPAGTAKSEPAPAKTE